MLFLKKNVKEEEERDGEGEDFVSAATDITS